MNYKTMVGPLIVIPMHTTLIKLIFVEPRLKVKKAKKANVHNTLYLTYLGSLQYQAIKETHTIQFNNRTNSFTMVQNHVSNCCIPHLLHTVVKTVLKKLAVKISEYGQKKRNCIRLISVDNSFNANVIIWNISKISLSLFYIF